MLKYQINNFTFQNACIRKENLKNINDVILYWVSIFVDVKWNNGTVNLNRNHAIVLDQFYFILKKVLDQIMSWKKLD